MNNVLLCYHRYVLPRATCDVERKADGARTENRLSRSQGALLSLLHCCHCKRELPIQVDDAKRLVNAILSRRYITNSSMLKHHARFLMICPHGINKDVAMTIE